RQLDCRRGDERDSSPEISWGSGRSDRSRLGPALDIAAHARIPARARLQRNRRFYLALALEGKLHSLCAGAIRQARLFLARDCDGSAADLRPRRNSRPLFPTLSLLETRRSDSPILL